MTVEDIHKLIKAGETQTCEFKRSFNVETIEALVAFANSDGGRVLVGVDDDGSVIGADIGIETIQH